MNVKYRGEELKIKVRRYCSGYGVALQLVDNMGLPYATATVNLPNEKLESDEVAIKDYSENFGVKDALIHAGVIEEPHRWIYTGYVKVPICRLTAEFMVKEGL